MENCKMKKGDRCLAAPVPSPISVALLFSVPSRPSAISVWTRLPQP